MPPFDTQMVTKVEIPTNYIVNERWESKGEKLPTLKIDINRSNIVRPADIRTVSGPAA